MIRAEEESFGRTLDRGLADIPVRPRDEPGLEGRSPGPAGLSPLRHLRLPARHDPAPGLGARPFRRHGGVRGRDGQAAGPRPGRPRRRRSIVAATEGEATDRSPTRVPRLRSDPRPRRNDRRRPGGKEAFLVFDQTPFYAEMGGQAGDSGTILIGATAFEVVDTVKDKAGRHLHKVDRALNRRCPRNRRRGRGGVVGRRRPAPGDQPPPHRDSPPPLGPPQGAGDPCPPGGHPQDAGPAAVRLLPFRGRDPGPAPGDRAPRQREGHRQARVATSET